MLLDFFKKLSCLFSKQDIKITSYIISSSALLGLMLPVRAKKELA